jgi:6-pyruvoyltetrahydropterin/6-carboxytetrahydropterin synthase
MILTVSKRLEFSASRRLFVPDWTTNENLAAFGPEWAAEFGTGRNYVAYFIFSGPVDAANGMLINISEMKRRAGGVLHDRFDHKFLNRDNPAFRDLPPTPEHVARQLFLELAPRFDDVNAKLVACHLKESPERSATFYADGVAESNYWFEFSAARRTMSPRLTPAENEKMFGTATALHGHNYRARLTFRVPKLTSKASICSYKEMEACLESLGKELDHRDLNSDVPAMKGRPMTTESLGAYLYERVRALLPLHRVRLHEREDFFAEVWREQIVFLGMRLPFYAAHRLQANDLSADQNMELYGKCNNPLGHGHRYLTEATVGGEMDPRSGSLFDFIALRNGLAEALRPWQNKHLDRETKDFADVPSTGENIVRALWPKVDAGLQHRLTRLRLWETPNNRFTLRRT